MTHPTTTALLSALREGRDPDPHVAEWAAAGWPDIEAEDFARRTAIPKHLRGTVRRVETATERGAPNWCTANVRVATPPDPAPFPLGAQVRLRSGGPTMTVTGRFQHDDLQVRTTWFAGDAVGGMTAPAEALVLVDGVPPEEGRSAVTGARAPTPHAAWHRTDQRMPPENHLVLVQVEAGGQFRSSVTVGYWKIQSNGPMWVTPGHDRLTSDPAALRRVTHWCACLPNPLNAPDWRGTQGPDPVLPSATEPE